MKYIAHRINTLAELHEVPSEFGVEIDIRDYSNKIVLSHDPFIGGVSLETYLDDYKHSFLILNIKSAGLEEEVISLLEKKGIKDYFFLDSSMSSVVQVNKNKRVNFAGRLSEFESVASLKLARELFSWAWVDCFTKLTLSEKDYEALHNELGIRICLTSPDLLGRPNEIELVARQLSDMKITPDAICTKLKNIHIWQHTLKDLSL